MPDIAKGHNHHVNDDCIAGHCPAAYVAPTTPREHLLSVAESLEKQAKNLEEAAKICRLNAQLVRGSLDLIAIRGRLG